MNKLCIISHNCNPSLIFCSLIFLKQSVLFNFYFPNLYQSLNVALLSSSRYFSKQRRNWENWHFSHCFLPKYWLSVSFGSVLYWLNNRLNRHYFSMFYTTNSTLLFDYYCIKMNGSFYFTTTKLRIKAGRECFFVCLARSKVKQFYCSVSVQINLNYTKDYEQTFV